MKDNGDAGGSPLISLRELGKVIDGKIILSDISIDVEPGSIVGLLGKNGAGKSSLIDVLLGFSPPSGGSSRVFDEDSFHLPAAAKRRIGFVPQQDELLDSLTGAQQLALNAALHPSWDEALIARLVREWGVPLDRRIQVLSGGERQKLATLLALGHRPDLLVLDEPASSLDPVARRQFLRELLQIAESHRGVLHAHRVRPGARRRQGVDHPRRPARLGGGSRYPQRVGGARDAPVARGAPRPPGHRRCAVPAQRWPPRAIGSDQVARRAAT